MEFIEKNDVEFRTNRKYLLYILIAIALLLMVFYFVRREQIKNKEKTSENYFIKNNIINNKITSIQELKQVLKETPSKLILYLSYHNSKKMYNFEKKIAKTISSYNISDVMYIYDITDLKEKVTNYREILDDTIDINVTKFPVIIIYEDGQISSYKIIENEKDIDKLFNKYDIDEK